MSNPNPLYEPDNVMPEDEDAQYENYRDSVIEEFRVAAEEKGMLEARIDECVEEMTIDEMESYIAQSKIDACG